MRKAVSLQKNNQNNKPLQPLTAANKPVSLANESVIFRQVCVIGLGLIGASLAQAIKDKGLTTRLVAVDRHAPSIAEAMQQGLLDEHGRLYLVCDGVLGVVHSQDMVHAAEQVEAGVWPLLQEAQLFADLPAAWGFVRSPWLEQGALK